MQPAANLVLEREVPLTPDQLWAGWTQPDLLKQWFCPAPWRTTECRIELQPGGEFFTRMEGPNGEVQEGAGCVLVAEAPHRLVWTSALGPGFQPVPAGEFLFTAVLTFTPLPNGGSLYRAEALHPDEATQKMHEEMGFEAGWNAALDQLVTLMGRG